MQEKTIEGKAADKEEADKLWLFTQQLIEDADKTSREALAAGDNAAAVDQSDVVDEPRGEGFGSEGKDGETKKSK